MSDYVFYLSELQTGTVIFEAPFYTTGSLTRRLQNYGTGDMSLPILDRQCPSTWSENVLPWQCMIVACDEFDRPVWWGVPNKVGTQGGGIVTWPCVTLEAYFDRRYMPDATFTSVDQALIARSMAEYCGDDVFGIGLEYDTPATGVFRDREYNSTDDGRVLQRLQQLSAVIGGFEWTIDVEWADADHSRFRKVFRTGYPNLGTVTDTPDHVFETTPGALTGLVGFDYENDWATGSAATHVTATGDGEGETRVISAPVIDYTRESAGWPRLEERIAFQGVTDTVTINDHAGAQAAQLFGGQQVITVETRSDQAPFLADLTLGDSARLDILTDEVVISDVWRIIGTDFNPSADTYNPTLARIGAPDDAGN